MVSVSISLGIGPIMENQNNTLSLQDFISNKSQIAIGVFSSLTLQIVVKYILLFMKLQYFKNLNFKFMLQQEI